MRLLVLLHGPKHQPVTSAHMTNARKELSVLVYFSQYISHARAELSQLFYYYLPKRLSDRLALLNSCITELLWYPESAVLWKCCYSPACLSFSLLQGSFCAGCPAGNHRNQVVCRDLTLQAWGAAGSHCSPGPASTHLNQLIFWT